MSESNRPTQTLRNCLCTRICSVIFVSYTDSLVDTMTHALPVYVQQATAAKCIGYFHFLPREAYSGARYCQGKLAVGLCPSVSPSVTLRYCGHIGSNSVKIISRLISVTFSLSADPNVMDLLQNEHPKFQLE